MTDQPLDRVLAPEPFKTPAITPTDAKKAQNEVPERAGTTMPKRDAVDRRLLSELRAGKGQIIDKPDEASSYPRIEGGMPLPDTDHDGIPDAWEKTHQLDPGDPADGSADRDGDGYTNVEEYLNHLVTHHSDE